MLGLDWRGWRRRPVRPATRIISPPYASLNSRLPHPSTALDSTEDHLVAGTACGSLVDADASPDICAILNGGRNVIVLVDRICM
jgi:hypothetical protein